MNPAEISMAVLMLLFAAVTLIAALVFDNSHGRLEQLRTTALFEHVVDRAHADFVADHTRPSRVR
jgi:hypothetical protein